MTIVFIVLYAKRFTLIVRRTLGNGMGDFLASSSCRVSSPADARVHTSEQVGEKIHSRLAEGAAHLCTSYSGIPKGCVLVGPRNARIFVFSNRILTVIQLIGLREKAKKKQKRAARIAMG